MNNYDPYTEVQLYAYLLKHKTEKFASLVEQESFNHQEAMVLLDIIESTLGLISRSLGEL